MKEILINKIGKRKEKLYWKDVSYSSKTAMNYRLRCPKCHKTFIMPKEWGVWKGCPVCWTRLAYKKGNSHENGDY